MEDKINAFMDEVKGRNSHEPEFIQAVQEVAETVFPTLVIMKFTMARIFY